MPLDTPPAHGKQRIIVVNLRLLAKHKSEISKGALCVDPALAPTDRVDEGSQLAG